MINPHSDARAATTCEGLAAYVSVCVHPYMATRFAGTDYQ